MRWPIVTGWGQILLFKAFLAFSPFVTGAGSYGLRSYDIVMRAAFSTGAVRHS